MEIGDIFVFLYAESIFFKKKNLKHIFSIMGHFGHTFSNFSP